MSTYLKSRSTGEIYDVISSTSFSEKCFKFIGAAALGAAGILGQYLMGKALNKIEERKSRKKENGQ